MTGVKYVITIIRVRISLGTVYGRGREQVVDHIRADSRIFEFRDVAGREGIGCFRPSQVMDDERNGDSSFREFDDVGHGERLVVPHPVESFRGDIMLQEERAFIGFKSGATGECDHENTRGKKRPFPVSRLVLLLILRWFCKHAAS